MVLPLVFLLRWWRACVDWLTAVGSAAVGAVLYCAAGRGAGEDDSPGQFICLFVWAAPPRRCPPLDGG